MKKVQLISAIALCLLNGTTTAAPTQILGLPLGGKLAYSPAVCPLNTDSMKRICWVGSPFTGRDHRRSGPAHIPNPDSRPLWAANALFALELKKDLTLTRIKLQSVGSDRSTIYQSIAGRFGPPITQDDLGARWMHPEANITLLCRKGSSCSIEFYVPASDAELEAASKKLQKEKSRPISP